MLSPTPPCGVHEEARRARFARGSWLCAFSSLLGALSSSIYVVFWVVVGIFFGVLYSAPPFRLRQTLWKPVVNFTVGAVPVLIVAAFAGATYPVF